MTARLRLASIGLGFTATAFLGCFSGTFLEGEHCTTNADCGPKLQCNAGYCGEALTCESGADCWPGYTCQLPSETATEGTCVIECADDLVNGECPCLLPDLLPGRCQELPVKSANKLDVLFVIDNTLPLDVEFDLANTLQSRLAWLANSSELFTASLTSYRVAITTTDAGVSACPDTEPEAGEFVLSSCHERLEDFKTDDTDYGALCTERCALPTLTSLPTEVDGEDGSAARPWIEGGPKGSNILETAPLQDTLACALPQGVKGCPYQQPLESMYQALVGSRDSESPNFGFLRDDAHLLIILVTNGYDCSVNDDWEEIFDPEGARSFWTNASADLPTPGVCWNAGVRCVADGDDDTYCVPADYDVSGAATSDPSAAVLFPVSRYRDYLDTIRDEKQSRDPNLEVVVTLVAGVPEDYIGGPLPASDTGDDEFAQAYGVAPSCGELDAFWALPAVRMRTIAHAFPSRDDSNIVSVCSEAGAMDLVDPVASAIQPLCMDEACVDGETGEANCRLTYEANDGALVEIARCTGNYDPDVTPIELPTLPAGEELCFFNNSDALPLCTVLNDNPGNSQFGFIQIAGFDLPDSVYASCGPSWDPTQANVTPTSCD